MKQFIGQSVEVRKLHHQTREDRQRKVYEDLQRRIFFIRGGKALAGSYPEKLANYERDAANLRSKLGIVDI